MNELFNNVNIFFAVITVELINTVDVNVLRMILIPEMWGVDLMPMLTYYSRQI